MAKRSKKKKKSPEVTRDGVTEAKEILPGKSSGVPWSTIVQALVIAAAVLWIYGPALHGGWLWDDELLVTDNALVQAPSGLWKIWFRPGSLFDYQPLKVSVVWLQWQLWGNHTFGYHLTNVFLHVLGAWLVWRLLSKFGLQLAWLGGLVFALHPVQVESVAWIAELKNTLSLPIFLLAICFWIDYDEHRKRRHYLFALGLFLAAMLCKPTMVMFPVVILLYGWWKRGRIGWNDLKASLPFFVVSLALGLVTLWFLHHHALGDGPVPMGGFFSRLACAGLSLSFYFSKCFLPVGLLPIYPRWVVDPPTLAQFLPWPILLATIYGLWTRRGSWGRHALLGLGFFLINLAPFVGFNTASYMAFTWVMDHVLYLPIIGLIGFVVAALGQIEKRLSAPLRLCGMALVGVVLVILAFESHRYAALYLNSETLWTFELRQNPDAYPAHNNLGKELLAQGRLSDAMGQFEEALRIDPDDFEAHNNLGSALSKAGRLPDAMSQFEEALRLNPDYAHAHYNLAVALFQAGRMSEAIDQDQQALRIDPDLAEACYNLGKALFQTGRVSDAIGQYQQALQINPDYVEARNNLGLALFQIGHSSEAMEQYRQALRLRPDYAEAHNNLGCALEQTNQFTDAMEQFEQALRIKPDYAEAGYNLGNVLLQTGRIPEAIEQYRATLIADPGYAGVHNNLGVALLQTGDASEAMEQFEEALRINPDFAGARNNLARLQAQQKAAPAKN